MPFILIGTVIWGIVWGIVVNKVVENKGYQENWFWWGFFFGIFALIIALTKQNITSTNHSAKDTAQVNEERMAIISSQVNFEMVDICSPIHISSWYIKKDNNANVALVVDLLNTSEKTISAVMLSVIGFNSFGDSVYIDSKDAFEILGQDLQINGGNFGKISAFLQNTDIRKVEIKVQKVCFSDGTIMENVSSRWVNTNQNPLSSLHIDCAKKKNPQSKFYATIENEFWQCTCGFVNTGNKCSLCGIEKTIALAFTKNDIENAYREYIKEIELDELEKAEQQKLKELNIKKNKKIAGIMAILIAFVVMLIVLFNSFIIPNIKYNKALTLVNGEKYEEAIAIFKELNGYRESEHNISICETSLNEIAYNNAIKMLDDGKYRNALSEFEKIKDYKDSATYYKKAYIGVYGEALYNLQGEWEWDNHLTITIKNEQMTRVTYYLGTYSRQYILVGENNKAWNYDNIGDSYKSSYEVINNNTLIETSYFENGDTREIKLQRKNK